MIFERGHFKTSTVKNLNESLRETRTFSKGKYESKTTIFISHKHSDLEDLEELDISEEDREEVELQILIAKQ